VTTLEWLDLAGRWVHLIAGIAWIGSSFYFIWLDRNLEQPRARKERVEGELWMVHSGGFYQVERRIPAPGAMPEHLHWFKWEAAITWISGFFLLGVVYYSTRGLYLVDPHVSDIGVGAGIAVGMGAMLVGWMAYDGLWRSALAQRPGLATSISLALVAFLAFVLCNVLSGRAAFVHLGAVLGTAMVANVWMRILPAQQRMIDATAAGREPDLGEALAAKRRSVHNSYMTFPVLILMLSTHFPGLYSNPGNWLVLLLLSIVGGGARHLMIGEGPRRHRAWVPVLGGSLALLALAPPMNLRAVGGPGSPDRLVGPAPSFQEAKAVIVSRCVICHSRTPADDTFGARPGGVAFDTDEQIQTLAGRIYLRAVVTQTMPLANRTLISDEERALLGRWVKAGASLK
jgi:uncharacterized membrane protein